MHDQANKIPGAAERRVQRLVVLQLLRDDHEDGWSVCDLSEELSEVEAQMLAGAIDSLTSEGVLCADGDALWASPALRRVDQVGLICV